MINHPDIGFCLQFKTQRLLIEFQSQKLDEYLCDHMKIFVMQFWRLFDLPIMITSIIRDDSEAHKNGKAIDIRCKYFSADVVAWILNYWLERFPRQQRLMKHGVPYIARSAYAHDSGQGFHIHLSVD